MKSLEHAFAADNTLGSQATSSAPEFVVVQATPAEATEVLIYEARLEVAPINENAVCSQSDHDVTPLSPAPISNGDPLLTRTRESRHMAQDAPPSEHPVHAFMRQPILLGLSTWGDATAWAIELFPVRFLWGAGDVLSFYMGMRGVNPLTGENIDPFEAKLCIIAAAIPFVPSKAITGPAKMIRGALEEGHHFLRTGDGSEIRRAMTPKNALKILFAFL